MKLITLNKGQFAMVDDEDYERLNQFKWHYGVKGYAIRRIWPSTLILMHRLVMNITDRKILIDHKDRNGLNNQKYNLRVCSYSENAMNRPGKKLSTSRFKGVSIQCKKGRWYSYMAKIKINNLMHHKSFPFTPEGEIAAAKQYDIWAAEHFKDFAFLNFPNQNNVRL